MTEIKNESKILESIIEETRWPILNKKNFKSLAIYTIFISLVGLILVSRSSLIYVILGMSILGWAANVLHNIYIWIKKEEDFRMIAKNYKLFPNSQSCIDYLYQNNLVFGRYNENSRVQIFLQPILSIVAGLVIYFVIRSWIQMSLGGNISWEPNMFFYWFFGFLSWFSYERILEILNRFSQKFSTNKPISEQFLNKIEKFEIEKSSIKKETKNILKN